MKNYYYAIATLVFVLGVLTVVTAQPGNGGFGDDPVDAPIDGGVSILVGAGIAYGAKKLNDRKKKQNNKDNNNN